MIHGVPRHAVKSASDQAGTGGSAGKINRRCAWCGCGCGNIKGGGLKGYNVLILPEGSAGRYMSSFGGGGAVFAPMGAADAEDRSVYWRGRQAADSFRVAGEPERPKAAAAEP